MASYRKRRDKWYAEVFSKGIRQSKTFPTKAHAVAWATQIETDIITGKYHSASDMTFGDLMDRYLKEVTPNKRGKRWEEIRIALLRKYKINVDGVEIALENIQLSDFKEPHVVAWRNARLKDVSGSSVVREWQILSNAMNIARKEWKWIQENPFQNVSQPKKNPPRDRIASDEEIAHLIQSSGLILGQPPTTIIARVMAAWLYARYTAKRCKEITRLKRSMVHLEEQYVEVSEDSKTGAREVPLFDEAIAILKPVMALGMDPVFGLTEAQVDSHWRKLTTRALVKDLTFHDSKHCACTWMAREKKVSVFDLGIIVGTRDLRTLSIYYNRSASDIAKGK